MIPEAIASICHEANRRFCKEMGDETQLSWEASPWWQQQSAIAGVIFAIENPDAPPSALHEKWMERKLSEGWKFGADKNPASKEHPCLLPYDQLPAMQRRKDILFRNIVLALTSGE